MTKDKLLSIRQNYDGRRRVTVAISNVWDILDPNNKGLPPYLQSACFVRDPRMFNMAPAKNGHGDFFVAVSGELHNPSWDKHLFAETDRVAYVLTTNFGPTRPAPVENIVEEIANQLGRDRKHTSWLPYIESRNIANTIHAMGMKLEHSPIEKIIGGATEFFGDKGNLHLLGEKEHDPTTVKYLLAEGFIQAWNIISSELASNNGVMVRARVGGGGFNNFLVSFDKKNTINVRTALGNFPAESINEVRILFSEFINLSPENQYLVINPALKIKSSPSLRVNITDEKIEFKGKYNQTFDSKGECIGGEKFQESDMDFIQNKLLCRAARPTVERMRKAGLRGSKGIDLMIIDKTEAGKMLFPNKVWRLPDGNIVSVAEVNPRMTSNGVHENTIKHELTTRGHAGHYSFAVQEVVPLKPGITLEKLGEITTRIKTAQPDIVLKFTNPLLFMNTGVSVGCPTIGSEAAIKVRQTLDAVISEIQRI